MSRVQVLILAACFAFLAAFFLGSGHAGEPEPVLTPMTVAPPVPYQDGAP